MTERGRAYLRVLLFMVAIAAVVAISAVGIDTILRRGRPASHSQATTTLQPQGPTSLTRTLLGLYLSLRQTEIEQAVNPADKRQVSFRVKPGETAGTIAPRLEKEGLIRDAGLFLSLVRYRGVDNALEAGDYQLSPSMTLDQIVNALQHGVAGAITVTIPEGWRMEQVAAKLAEADDNRGADNLERAADCYDEAGETARLIVVLRKFIHDYPTDEHLPYREHGLRSNFWWIELGGEKIGRAHV